MFRRGSQSPCETRLLDLKHLHVSYLLPGNRKPAINPHISTIDHSTLIPTKELDRVRNLRGLAKPPRRYLREVLLLLRFVCPRLCSQRSPRHGRAHSVGRYPLGPPLARHAPRMSQQASLGSTVCAMAVQSYVRGL